MCSDEGGVPQDPIISIADLTFRYPRTERPALAGINLDIRAGEYVALVGLNGAGKTTLGLCLNGIIPNMLMGELSGYIRVNGQDPWQVPVREMARSVGIVFDNPEFQMSQITAAEEVALGLENLGVPHDEMQARVADALALVGLAGFEERSPMGLSGGQQQRLAIAATLVMRPSILFMDEPTSNLDPLGKGEVFEIARRLNQNDGMTVIVAEHEVEVLAEYADRVVVLDEGRIVLQGSPSEVFGEVAGLRARGLRPPQVTEFAHRLGGGPAHLPVTLDGALAWLEARA